MKDAVKIEYALNFSGEAEGSPEVNVVRHKSPIKELSEHNKLQESLD